MVLNSRRISTVPGFTHIFIGILILGSLWGLSETVLSGALRAANFPYRSGLLTGIGMGLMGISLSGKKRLLMPIGMSIIAILVTLLVVPILHVSVTCKANSSLALFVQSGSLSLAAGLLIRKVRNNIYGRMAIGGLGALLSSLVFYFAGIHFAPCNYLLSFAGPVSFIVSEGVIWAAFSAILFPLGLAVGEWIMAKPSSILVPKSLFEYAASIALIIFSWGISALAIATGL